MKRNGDLMGRERRTLALVALAAITLGVVGLAGVDLNALCLLPALALALPLLMRRFPGERALADLARARATRRRRLQTSAARTGRVFTVAPHGGLLIGCALAVRPPPALFSAS